MSHLSTPEGRDHVATRRQQPSPAIDASEPIQDAARRLPDCHLHTPLCRHADGDPPTLRASARERGLPEIAFCDHVPSPHGYDPMFRMAMSDWAAYREAVLALRDDGDEPAVLFGVEIDAYPRAVDYLPALLDAEPLDLVLGAVHYIGDWAFDNPDTLPVWSGCNVHAVWSDYFSILEQFVRTRWFDVVAHIDVPKKFGYRPPDRIIRELAAPALDAVADCGLAIELNTCGLRRPAREIYPSAMLLTMARERDIPICFSSDAHRPADVGADFAVALRAALDAGYTQYARFHRRCRTLHPLPALPPPPRDRAEPPPSLTPEPETL